MSLLAFFQKAGVFLDEFRMGQTISELVNADREHGMRALQDLVQRWTPQQLDQFEVSFLNASMGMFTRDQRIRSLELYAYMKLLETSQYGKWRGFSTSTEGGALC